MNPSKSVSSFESISSGGQHVYIGNHGIFISSCPLWWVDIYIFQKWKYYIYYEHMTLNTEGFDSKCMWYMYGDCILTKYSFYRSALTFIIAISEHISLECHPSIYRHPLYNTKCQFPNGIYGTLWLMHLAGSEPNDFCPQTNLCICMIQMGN